MSEQQQTVLGPKAREYVRQCLSTGLCIVAAQTSSRLEGGCVWAFLPSDLVGAAGADPEWSLSVALPGYQGRGNADEMLAHFILSYLQEGHGRYAIFQDWNSMPDSPWLSEGDYPYFIFGGEVYNFLSSASPNLDADRILDVMRGGYTANSRLNAGVLTTAPGIPGLTVGQAIRSDVQQALSGGVEHVIVDGFDGDREIVWSKFASMPPSLTTGPAASG